MVATLNDRMSLQKVTVHLYSNISIIRMVNLNCLLATKIWIRSCLPHLQSHLQGHVVLLVKLLEFTHFFWRPLRLWGSTAGQRDSKRTEMRSGPWSTMGSLLCSSLPTAWAKRSCSRSECNEWKTYRFLDRRDSVFVLWETFWQLGSKIMFKDAAANCSVLIFQRQKLAQISAGECTGCMP